MKLFKAYIIAAVICLSLTSIAACIFVADENAKRISLGEENAVIVFSSVDEKLYEDAVNPLPLIEKLKEAVKTAASLAPPPISNIYWFAVNSEKTAN